MKGSEEMQILNLVALVTLLVGGIHAFSRSEFDLPTARIEAIEGSRLRPWTRIDPNNFETVIDGEGVDGLKLECAANYPVQWIYTGNGIPEFTTINKYARRGAGINNNDERRGGETSTEYQATLIINAIKEHHTGRYQCSPGEFVDGGTYFQIYVPGRNLFTALNGHSISLPKNNDTLIIPCTVSNPNAAVTLDKSEGGSLKKIKVRSYDAVTFDPKIGFKVRTDRVDNPEGIYVCTARYGSSVRNVEYRVAQGHASAAYYLQDQPDNLNKCKKRCGENAYCDIIDGRETCKCVQEFNGDPEVKCVIKCNAHTDCPDTMSCFVDRQCRSPCVHSAHGCGVNAKCRVENHRPVCYCPPGWIGDETIQCFNNLQGTEPDSEYDRDSKFGSSGSTGSYTRPRPSNVFSSGIKCGSNTDCPRNMTCIRSGRDGRDKECVDPCSTRSCGINALCMIDDRRRSYCLCPPGMTGDARIDCSPIGKNRPFGISEPLLQGDDPYNKDSSFLGSSKPQDISRRYRRCPNPDICGLNAECRLDPSGSTQCLCTEGYMGQPPKCRPECKENKDCPSGHICVSDTRVGYPTCAKSCGSKVCGAHADCVDISDGSGKPQQECFCPPGSFGDPFVKCEAPEARVSKECGADYDCGVKLRCDLGAEERKCVDPCAKKYCPGNLVCDVDNHKPVCKCPAGYTGNEYIGCNRDTSLSQDYFSRCGNMSCGVNGECKVVASEAKCSCRSGYIGRYPACIAECYSNTDCPSDLTCVSRRCKHRCTGCGRNARCRVVPNASRDSVCTCRDGYEGNPYTECVPVI